MPAVVGATNVAVVAAFVLNVPPPATDHVTPCPFTSLVTVAAKFSDCPITNPPRFGLSVTLKGPLLGAATVIVATSDLVVSATDVAVSVTVGGLGIAAGAVYVTAT